MPHPAGGRRIDPPAGRRLEILGFVSDSLGFCSKMVGRCRQLEAAFGRRVSQCFSHARLSGGQRLGSHPDRCHPPFL
jgi:hypothetical protein